MSYFPKLLIVAAALPKTELVLIGLIMGLLLCYLIYTVLYPEKF